MRTPLALLALLLAAPFAFAHDPPGPVLECRQAAAMHDYATPSIRPVAVHGDFSVGVCEPGRGLAGSDYEHDFFTGGALLAVDTGDGVSSGALACYGVRGHHASHADVFAWDVGGFGPRFIVVADHARASDTGRPCGDDVSEPCVIDGDHPPPPGVSSLERILTEHFPNDECNPLDRVLIVESAAGVSGAGIPFGPGIDGVYTVFVKPDLAAGRVPVAGHVWT